MSIAEEKRVAFTKQLRDLRDSDAKEIVFSPLLTSDERKFVHKISQDFGLKSKSAGKAAARFITVMKKNANSQKVAGIAPILWTPQHDTLQGLADPCFATAAKKFVINDYRVRESGSKTNVPTDFRTTGQVVGTYAEAQKQRAANSNYHSIQKKRSALPASHYREAVCNLLKEHQIVLISGETGTIRFVLSLVAAFFFLITY